MSGPFAIAAVTAVLKDLLNNAIVDHDLSALGNVTVTSLPPDRISTNNAEERSQLNVFMYAVTPNSGWRNVGLPSFDNRGARISNPPLALDLHYLLTAYSAQELHGEALLGYGMQMFHERPVLTRDMINMTLRPSLPAGISLPSGLELLATSDLADQIEQIKISPISLSTEEMSKLWAAMQARYRPTAAYQVSVVLIEATRPARSPLPVLTLGEGNRGPIVLASLTPDYPTIETLELPGNRVAALLGDAVTLRGHHFAGGTADPAGFTVTALLSSPRLPKPEEVVVPPGNRTDTEVTVTLPVDVALFPAGAYTLSLMVESVAEPGKPRLSPAVPLLIGPQIQEIDGVALPQPPTAPISLARTDVVDSLGNLTCTVTFSPEARPDQLTTLALGNRDVRAEPHDAPTGLLTFVFRRIAAGTYRMRIRVDGIESPLINRSDKHRPVFDDSQQVELT